MLIDECGLEQKGFGGGGNKCWIALLEIAEHFFVADFTLFALVIHLSSFFFLRLRLVHCSNQKLPEMFFRMKASIHFGHFKLLNVF